jgi:succinate-semialdehyde dehydrogenase/glutarate-semialdehyde dehydrogenase
MHAVDPDARKLVSYSPGTGEPIGSVEIADAAAVAAAVDRARAAQGAWAARGVRERARILRRVQERVWDRGEELVRLMALECGKPRFEVVSLEIGNHVVMLDYFTRHAERILAPRPIHIHGFLDRASYLHYEPLGVVGVVSPWNYPFALANGPSAMSLLAGNAVVVKPSELTPLVQDLAREIYLEGGVPEDVFQVVHGAGDAGAELVARVDGVVFTGSTKTGRKVAAICGERLVPCVLELGGKAPALVLADAALERTAHGLVWGAFCNAGQTCAAVERTFVGAGLHDALVARVVEETKKLRVGDPATGEVDVGPMNNPRQLAIVEELVDDAVRNGARVLTGGKRRDGPGLFYEPTVLVDVRPEMRIAREEIFGPVLPILRVEDPEEMLRLANDHPLGLLGYVFSKDLSRAKAIAERLEVGTTMINDVIATNGFPETPWGGVKGSGLGHTHSDDGLRRLCQQRHVHYHWLRALRHELWWYPYTRTRESVVVKLQHALFGVGRRRLR